MRLNDPFPTLGVPSGEEAAIDSDRFVPSGVWHIIVDTKRALSPAECGPYGSFAVPRLRLMNVTEKKGNLTLALGWDLGFVIIEDSQRAFSNPRSLTSQDLSDAFFALWRAAVRLRHDGHRVTSGELQAP